MAYIFWHSIWHSFRHILWHSTWHSFWHILWHSIWHSFWHYLALYPASILTFFLVSTLAFYLASILTFYLAFCLLRSGARGWGPAVPTQIWSSRLRSGSAHWYLEFAVGRRRKEEGGRRKEEEANLIKSRDPHLAGLENGGQVVFLQLFSFISFMFLWFSFNFLLVSVLCF